MGSLKDEVYEKLDYLSQLTEIVIGPQAEILAKVPDRIELNLEHINNIKTMVWNGSTGFELSPTSVLYYCAGLSKEDFPYVDDIKGQFEFEFSDDFEIDFANKKLVGYLSLVKKSNQLDEKLMLQSAVSKAQRELKSHAWSTKRLKDKTATVLNILEPNKGTEWLKNITGRVQYAALHVVRDSIAEIILENKWRIRDADVIVKMGEWIDSYLSDATETSVGLVNLIKLKMMVDKDRPIYSVDEVINVGPV